LARQMQSFRSMLPNVKITLRTRLGFIGLGYLGSRIARRLATAGFPMVVYDLDRRKAVELAALGAEVAPHPGKLTSDVDVVLSCLPDEHAVQAAYLGTGNVLGSAKPGTRIIELSTISPETSRQLHRAAAQFAVSALDVTVSGSTSAAEAGALTLFGGGDRDAFEAAEAIFSAIAKQWFYMGPAGSGVAMKLVVNALLGVGMQAVAEAVALGSRLDLPRDLLFDTLAKTAVVAPAHLGKLATAKKSDYSPQFPVRLMRKDFGLVLDAAAQLGLSMPATEAAAAINSEEAEPGIEEDFSAVIRRMEQEAGVEKTLPPAA
jgi:3-hydroxyisobutyrate dehydrogenase-like beta-hydroxyacid dehydrogenase